MWRTDNSIKSFRKGLNFLLTFFTIESFELQEFWVNHFCVMSVYLDLFSWWGKGKSSCGKYCYLRRHLSDVMTWVLLHTDEETIRQVPDGWWPPTCKVTIYPLVLAGCCKLPGRAITHITATITAATALSEVSSQPRT